MIKEDPFILAPANMCPMCGGQLALISTDVEMSIPNEMGIGNKSFERLNSRYFKCLACQSSFAAIRQPDGISFRPGIGSTGFVSVKTDEEAEINPFKKN
jgi:hypothetical protein